MEIAPEIGSAEKIIDPAVTAWLAITTIFEDVLKFVFVMATGVLALAQVTLPERISGVGVLTGVLVAVGVNVLVGVGVGVNVATPGGNDP